MAVQITDLLSRVTDSTTGRPVISALANPGKAIGAPSINLTDVTNWTTTSVVYISIYKTKLVSGATVKDVTTQTDWKGILPAASTTISNLTLTGGTDQVYVAGDIVELTPTSRWAKDLYDNISYHANPDGSLKSSAVQTALNLGSGTLNGWNPLAYTPDTVTYNGNRSYDLVFNGVDLTGTVSNGMRLRTTRTVAAPTQSASLNGTSQYFSKASPASMTFTVTCTAMGARKLNAHSIQWFGGRTTGTNGFRYGINASGQLVFEVQPGAGTTKTVTSNQSVPLNKWFRFAFQIDLNGTCQIMLNGVAIPSTTAGSATSLTQASTDFQLGAAGGAGFTNGKMAQDALFSTKLADATVRSYESQTYSGSESSLISAYSFDNSINDLNTTNANNLTNNGSATFVADAPWTQDDTATPGGALDYAILMKKSFSTNTTLTVQVPEGCTIPTSGGITAVAYSSMSVPYGFPRQSGKWQIKVLNKTQQSQASTVANTWYNVGSYKIDVPVGSWKLKYSNSIQNNPASTSTVIAATLSTGSSSESDPDLTSKGEQGTSGAAFGFQATKEKDVDTTAVTSYYFNLSSLSITGSSIYIRGEQAEGYLLAENAYL